MFSKFCSHIERLRSENSFLQSLTYESLTLPLAQHFLCLTLQKKVFQSLPFHIWTQFGEQIANIFFIKRVIFFPAQQALEKIDRTRGHAAHLFATLVTSKDVQYIPHKDQVLQCFPEKIRQSGSDFDEFGWSVESQTFPIFAKLLRLKSYTKATLLGLYHVCTYF